MVTTPFLEIEDQLTGENNNTWGDVLDANLAILEQAIARSVSIPTTGGTTTLTSSQNRFPIIRITGTLLSNAIIQVRTAQMNWIFINGTGGAFTLTVKTAAGTGVLVPQGRAVKLYCDGVNVLLVDLVDASAVYGPASATDGRVAVFDGVTGRLLRDGGIIIQDLARRDVANTFAANQVFNSTVGIGTASPAERLHMSGGNVRFDGEASNPANGVYVTTPGANASTERIGFYNIHNENNIPVAGVGFAVFPNGNTAVTLDFTPLGIRTTDRRRAVVYASGIGTSGEINILGARQFNSDGGRIFMVAETNDASQTSFIQIDHRSITPGGSWYMGFRHGNNVIGTISQVGTNAVNYGTSSDHRLKENVQPLTGGLRRLALCKPVIYTHKTDGSPGEGFLAHELAAVIPNAVVGEKDAEDENGNPIYQSVDHSRVMPTAIAAMKEQQAMILEQKEMILEQQAMIVALTARVAALEAAQ